MTDQWVVEKEAPGKEETPKAKGSDWVVEGEQSTSSKIAGTAAGVGRGFVEGLVSMPGQFLKIGLAQQRVGEAVIQKFFPEFGYTQKVANWIDEIDSTVNQKIQSVGPKGYSTHIGPVEVSGEALGSILSGVALPGAIVGKASKAAGFAGRVWSSMKMGAAFGAATSVPDVILSKDVAQAHDRLINAGINVGVGGLLAGALHGSSEAVGRLLSLRSSKVPSLPSKSSPPAPLGGYVEDTRYQQPGAVPPRPPVEPHLDIKPGLEDRFAPSDEELARIMAEREGITPEAAASRVAEEALQMKRERWITADQDEQFMRRGREYAELKKKIDDRAPELKAMLQVSHQVERGASERAEAARFLKEQRADQSKLNHANAELESIAEVIAARGRPVGELWEPSSKSRGLINELQKQGVMAELTRRIKLKQDALKGSNPEGVMNAGKPPEIVDILEEARQRLIKLKELPHEPVGPRVSEVANEYLAEKMDFIQKATLGTRNFFYGIADAYRKTVNPMSRLSPEVSAQFDILGQSDRVEMALAQLGKEVRTALPDLSDRQVFSLLNDPNGVKLLEGITIDPRLKGVIDTYRVAFDKLFDVGVRKGVISAESFWENYAPRIYDMTTAKKLLNLLRTRGEFQGENAHSFQRVFKTLAEAKELGFKPKTLDVAQIMTDYVRSLNRTITTNELMHNLEAVAKDKFRYLPEGESLPGYRKAPEGLLGNLSVLEDGRPAHRYIEEPLWRVVDNLVSHTKPGGPIEKWNIWNKKIRLAIDVYHLWQIMRGYSSMTWEFPFGKWKEGYAMLSPEHTQFGLVKKLIDTGTLTPGMGDVTKVEFDKGFQNAVAKMPWASKLIEGVAKADQRFGVEAFSDYLWNRVSPGLKVLMAVKNVEKLLADPKMQHLSEREILQAAGRMANRVGGGNPWREFGRSREFERAARLMVLAPNWIETRFRLFGGGFQAAAEAGGLKATSAAGKLYGKYWTGYVAQGMLTALAGNAIIRTAYPEVVKHKEAGGMGWFTHITFPVEDRNGRPLVMSPYPGLDYILEFANDWDRFYKNRTSPAMNAFLHLVTGVDYKGAKDRPASWSFDTFLNLVEDVVPVPMFFGGMDRTTTSETPGYEGTKMLFRSLLLGLHNHPTYPVALRDEEDFLKNEAAELRQRLKGAKLPVLKTYWNWQARRHDDKVHDWIERAKKTEGAEKILSTMQKYQRQLFVGTVPGEAKWVTEP